MKWATKPNFYLLMLFLKLKFIPMKRILVPVNFSQVSKDAVKSAATLARKSGGDIVLFHVIEDSEIVITGRTKLFLRATSYGRINFLQPYGRQKLIES